MQTPPRDILWYNSATGEDPDLVYAGQQDRRARQCGRQEGAPDRDRAAVEHRRRGDMNGNGRADIVWHNNTAGETQIWFIEGQRIVAGRYRATAKSSQSERRGTSSTLATWMETRGQTSSGTITLRARPDLVHASQPDRQPSKCGRREGSNHLYRTAVEYRRCWGCER